jgi:hypothetical protein
MKLKIFKKQSGTILFMAIMILTTILTISLGVANLVMSGIVMSGTQTRSVKAYFLADSGIEYTLWQTRRQGYVFPITSSSTMFSGNPFGSNNGGYSVGYSTYNNVLADFSSTGSYGEASNQVKRTVEIQYSHSYSTSSTP